MSENNTSAATQTYLIAEARARALQGGICQLSDVELLAILLRTAGEKAPYDKAVRLLTSFGSLRSLLTAPFDALRMAEVTETQYVTIHAALELTRRHYHSLMTAGPILNNPRATREYLRMRLRDLPHEVFGIVLLDNRNRVIKFVELFRGTIDGACVHAREVVKLALEHNAASVILTHNHPSGIAEPSQADELITRRLKDALGMVDIRVLDHLIVGDGCCESFADRGLL